MEAAAKVEPAYFKKQLSSSVSPCHWHIFDQLCLDPMPECATNLTDYSHTKPSLLSLYNVKCYYVERR